MLLFHFSKSNLKAFLLVIALTCSACEAHKTQLPTPAAYQINDYIDLLQDKNVGLVVNPTSEVNGVHLVDTLLSLGINIKAIMAPEHGFRGEADAGQSIDNGVDERTGIPIISLYGDHKKPTKADLADLDIVIFDIQDVGLRFYTYISTMHYVMEACAEFNTQFMVLDRPNPNGYYIDGPVLEMEFQSFVGMHPIPIVHGLTVGELALMINGEGWLGSEKCDLKVIKMSNYSHQDRYSLPVKPSPNLPNDRSIELYASLCLLEPTLVSIGRGTAYPFQVIGYPDKLFGEFSFTPESIPGMSTYPKLEDVTCYGKDLRTAELMDGFNLNYLLDSYHKVNKSDSFFTSPNFFDKLAGTESLRIQIIAEENEATIRQSWQPKLEAYKTLRRQYLLYPDFD
jgi:uncharacterized protein YbbC (DUF1343 family)